MEENTVYNIPPLPVDKDFHMFVCYARGDLDIVHILVENLEKDGLKCSYHERDFTAGHSILTNMSGIIRKSMYMLVILSENFAESGYAQHEVAEAIHIQISEGYSIIPIMIEPCTLPDFLKHTTYIDAQEKEVNEMHKLVIGAVTNHQTVADFQNVTGISIEVHLKWFRERFCSMARYKLEFDAMDRQMIAERGLQLTEHDIDEIETIVSNSNLVRYLHLFDNIGLVTMFIWFLLILFCAFTNLVLILALRERSKEERLQKGAIIGMLISLEVIIVVTIFLRFCCCHKSVCTKKKPITYDQQIWETLHLDKKLAIFNAGARERQLIVFYVPASRSLMLMRYDFKPCQSFFMRRCERKENLHKFQMPGESLMNYTNRLFESFLRSHDVHMLRHSSAQQKRHKMANEAKCICLLVEEMIC